MDDDRDIRKRYHAAEAARIAGELDNLGPGYADDGIVRTILRRRVEQERRRAEDGCDCAHCRGAARRGTSHG